MIRKAIYCLVVIVFICGCSPADELTEDEPSTEEGLDARYQSQWDKEEYRVARTANAEDYLVQEEKDVFYYLNLMRINPPLFAQTYATGYDGDQGWSKGYAWDERKKSLIEQLLVMEPVPMLYPDAELYELARCFASESGKLGITGHDRSQTGCATGYNAECCSYGGLKSGLSIVMALLIDAGENNAELGHRRICVSGNYVRLGVAIQPHITYEFNAVLDFGR
jgi:hypothetical protein